MTTKKGDGMVNLVALTHEKEKLPVDVLSLIQDGDDILLPLANGEPKVLLDVIEQNASRFNGVRIHQMHAIRERDYINGKMKRNVKHVAYFLSEATRKAYLQGNCDLVPNHFHQVPRILQESTKTSLVLACASPMDEHGYFSLGTQADYVASFIGKVPFFLEVNQQMPRTFGENQIHVSQIEGFIQTDYPLHEIPMSPITSTDQRIAEYVAEQIPDGATIQVGIGAIPNAVISLLQNNRHLGIHTELISDGIVDLVKTGVVDGTLKNTNKGKIVTTFALGTKKLYQFIDENPGVEFLPVDMVNDPREIAKEDRMISINSTTEVDFYGQCASETIAGKYYSSSGGQADFARGVHFSKEGKGFICMHSTAKEGTISKIRPLLSRGSVVTTSKNDVDRIVTEYGVAELKGKSIEDRTKALIAIAHPRFREELTYEAIKNGFIL
ncbi:acyl-CoA hydrolase [Oikeobacillus pervagus]|uniref:Acyl-CoA hydrolase n=1 Tax=Oikeobacillus pervagus TaxID=1325931 RepID=A0AAJ1WK95_9BACI|nr:acetyl-CoA hydrolase/transferase C-terminal domain-containing protein [Oikeobacillus pervagus]MDQ0216358.1 acyl-CoA hydrolase [Oikeobacillus pervagus]